MGSGGKVLRHTGVVMVMELGIRLTDALVSVMVARYLAPQGFGLLAFALSFSNLFSMIPGFGMGSLTLRDISRNPKDVSRYLGNGLYAKAGLSLLALLLIGGAGWLAGFPRDKMVAVLLAGLFMATEASVRFSTSFFQAVQKPGMAVRVNLLTRAGWLIGSIVVMGLGGGIPELIGIRVLVTAVGLVFSVVLVETFLDKADWRLDVRFIRDLLSRSFPFVLFRLKAKMTGDMDNVMISFLRDDVMTGWYSAAQKLLKVFSFVPTSFSQASLPILSKNMAASPEEVKELIQRSVRLLLMVSLPISVVSCALAGPIIRLVYGPAYAPAVSALRILAWGVPFLFLNNGSLVAAVSAAGKERQGVKLVMAGGLFSALSNLAVIPLFGHSGAAATSTMSEVFIAVMQVRLLRRSLPGAISFRPLAGLLWAAAGAGTAAYLMRGMPLFLALSAALAVYAILLLLLGQVRAAELSLLWTKLKKRG